ncbi:hypothetical protein [Streptomyces sp. AMCC400023]|uniref:hypothetical protein n=1 Tax=Streptomyces sp. AMCC400023 TaxID=2056258 RepID=UPI001F3B3B6B|nr:hypothetical protein [Streptomyces sp. AMCC400023]UJV42957.1 hypothetical protein CVT30_26720 [Streptomyces sp. AMCC400023]
MIRNAAVAALFLRVETAGEELLAAADAFAAAQRAERRAVARVEAGRVRRAEAVKELRAARRAGKRVGVAERKVANREAKVTDLVEAARAAKKEVAARRRVMMTARRRWDRLSLKAATAASRAVGEIAERLGKTTLSKAPAADPVLPADQVPAVEEIEARADEFAALDAKAKAAAKAADAVKKWLRQIPAGAYGRVAIARTPGGTVIDGDQVAIDYLDNGLGAPPRKARKDTFKVLVTAQVAALPAAA